MTEAPAIRIRPAAADDLPAVLALYAQPDLDDGVVLGEVESRAMFERMRSYPDYTLYVAEEGGDVVGTFLLLVMRKISHLGAPGAVVEDVAVAPDRQGHGVGRAMMERARELAREQGCYKLALSSNMKRERAHAFYETLGFERHGYSFRVDVKAEARDGR